MNTQRTETQHPTIWILCQQAESPTFFQALEHAYHLTFYYKHQDFFSMMNEFKPDLLIIAHPDYFEQVYRDDHHRWDVCTILYGAANCPRFLEFCRKRDPDVIIQRGASAELIQMQVKTAMKFKQKKGQSHYLFEQLGQDLTPKEKELLSAFLQAKDHCLSKNELAQAIWKNTHVVPKTIEVHLSNMRKKIRLANYDIINLGNNGFKLNRILYDEEFI